MNTLKKGESIQKRANRIARQHGYGTATKIVLGTQDRVLRHDGYGYYKDTTREKVSNAYRNNFGWKNTHYEHATTTVEVAVPLNYLWLAL
jgi:hypothetical protein